MTASRPKPHLDFIYNFRHRAQGWAMEDRRSLPAHSTWDDVRCTALASKDDRYEFEPLRREWPKFAWPGGYPLFYLTEDGGVLSPKAANENLELTLSDDPQWCIVGCQVNYEDRDLYCDHTNERIPCAYESED